MSTAPDPALQPWKIGYDVLVCTYNGAPYIAEQLESILRQQPPPCRVLVSDDGSTDQTCGIVNQIAATTSIPVEIIAGPGQGIIRNVLNALPQTTAQYVFLADQDDVWLDNKAKLFSEKMHDRNEPHLIFSDAWVWHRGQREKQTFWTLDELRPHNAKDPRRLAFHNSVQGASACVNRALITAMTPTARHPDIVMHDWWLALIASGTGRIDPIPEPTLLYRQHENNQVGTRSTAGRRKRNFLQTLSVANRILNQGAAFGEHYESHMNADHRRFFKAYREAMRRSRFRRLCFILRHRPLHRDLNRTLKLWASMLLVKGARAR